ncbi:MAG: metal-sulfur cluster assembly factor [Gemmatimonadales bacterium]|jgi:metal-sulfur cluster biosynthetic enzyme
MTSIEEIRDSLRQVKDPELGLNIIDLGLVYDVLVDDGDVHVLMTLTSPGCPAGDQILRDADAAIRSLDAVTNVEIELVWEPFWNPDRIDPKVRLLMGF